MMVGDMLIHTSVWMSGRRSDGTYNYDHFFANLADEFANNDIAIVNQETILILIVPRSWVTPRQRRAWT